MKQPIDENKIVVFSGAGVSAESGIKTFRDGDGLWNEHRVEDVATLGGWKANPQMVLDFYNSRRQEIAAAEPNDAHKAIAALEEKYDVIVITQNIDDLHERAGSSNVIHVHGEITKARSFATNQIFDIGYQDIQLGDKCSDNAQLRPHVVWFGEAVQNLEIAKAHFKTAKRVLVVGTSLAVYPVAGLLKKARYHAEKIIVAFDIEKKPYGYTFVRGKAGEMVPFISRQWLDGRRVV